MKNWLMLPFAVPAALGQGWLAAQIPAYLVTKAGINEMPHWICGVSGALIGLIIGISFLFQEKHSVNALAAIWTPPALAGGAGGLIHVALILYQEEALFTPLILALLGLGLFVSSIGATYSMASAAQPRWVARSVLFGAFAIAIYGLFLSGTEKASFKKEENSSSAHCVVSHYRWMGFVAGKQESISSVTDWELMHNVDIPGDGISLLTESGEQLIVPGNIQNLKSLAGAIADSLRAFLESERTHLELQARTPYIPLSLIIVISGAVVLVGVSFFPKVEGNRPKSETLSKWMGLACIVVGGGTYGTSELGQATSWYASMDNAKSELESRGYHVVESELTFRDEVLTAWGWRVTIDDSEFGDKELKEIVPMLEEAPALSLNLSGTQVTDAGIEAIQFLGIYMLDVRGTQVTNEMFSHLRSHLPCLDARDSAVTADGLRSHRDIRIERLLFTDPYFTNKSLDLLPGIPGIQYVLISGSKVSHVQLDQWCEDYQDRFPSDDLPVINLE